MPVIVLDSVGKAFKGRPLLYNVNAEINEGITYGIQGPNGSGKSVLFKLMCGFLKPDEGTVSIDPAYLSPSRVFPEHFGVIIDRPGSLPHRTGLENLRSLAKIRGKIGDDQIIQAMERVGLDPDLRQKVRHYSLGMKQKLALAQAIMEDQRVLLLDEPFNALDASSVHHIRALLRDLSAEGRTIVMTSHNQEDIDELCQQVHLVNGQTLEKVR